MAGQEKAVILSDFLTMTSSTERNYIKPMLGIVSFVMVVLLCWFSAFSTNQGRDLRQYPFVNRLTDCPSCLKFMPIIFYQMLFPISFRVPSMDLLTLGCRIISLLSRLILFSSGVFSFRPFPRLFPLLRSIPFSQRIFPPLGFPVLRIGSSMNLPASLRLRIASRGLKNARLAASSISISTTFLFVEILNRLWIFLLTIWIRTSLYLHTLNNTTKW